MNYQEINARDAHEITAIDKRIAELNVEREQLLQRKQIILNRPKSHQTRANLSTAQKIYLFKNCLEVALTSLLLVGKIHTGEADTLLLAATSG